jgi:hypothetical protein
MIRAASRPGVHRRALSRSELLGASAVAGILVFALASQLVDYGFYDLRLRLLDANEETGILGLLGQAAIIAAAASAVSVAARFREAAPVALAMLLTFLAIDHMTKLHEEVPHWRLAYLPPLAVTFLALAGVARGPVRASRSLLACGVALLAASLALHEIGEWLMERLGASSDSVTYQLKLAVKHGTEVAGWLLVALGLARG